MKIALILAVVVFASTGRAQHFAKGASVKVVPSAISTKKEVVYDGPSGAHYQTEGIEAGFSGEEIAKIVEKVNLYSKAGLMDKVKTPSQAGFVKFPVGYMKDAIALAEKQMDAGHKFLADEYLKSKNACGGAAGGSTAGAKPAAGAPK